MESSPILTGNEVVDSLQVLQATSDALVRDEFLKRMHVGKMVELQPGADRLIGQRFLVGSNLLLAQRPGGDPKKRLLFEHGLLFEGILDSYEYILDNGIPLDSLMLDFVEPAVVGVAPEEETFFKVLKLQVPVLAISSCIDLAAA